MSVIGSTYRPVIRIQQGNEYRPRMDILDQEDLFFTDSYRQARKGLEMIWRINSKGVRTPGELLQFPDSIIREELRGSVNNVLAFCADRGQGKTTAMRSFCSSLENYCRYKGSAHKPLNEKIDAGFWKDTELPKLHFIGKIDPTAMISSDSILKMVISRMFSRFCEALKQRESEYRHDSYGMNANTALHQDADELAEMFVRCFRDIDMLLYNNGSSEVEQDDLDKIAALGDSSNLIVSVFRLVHHYLTFMEKTNENLCMIIQIDDTDLQIDRTYQILEDVRRYLLLPNVMIILAANMTQLENTLEQHFLEKYNVSLRYPNSMVSVEQCHAIAELYLEKVIPSSRRIFLPSLEASWKSIWVQYAPQDEKGGYDEGNNLLKRPVPKDGVIDCEKWGYQHQILNLLYRKTGIVFLPPHTYMHNLVPGNMRELTHFLAYFCAIDDLEGDCYEKALQVFSLAESPECLKLWKINLEKFEHYVVDLWSAANLRENSRRFFIEFVNQPMHSKHGYVLQNLPDYYAHERQIANEATGFASKTESEYRQEFICACQKRGVVFTRVSENDMPSESYGNVMAALDVLSELVGAERQYKFIYAIRIYYTIQFHKMLVRRLSYPHLQVRQEDNILCFMRNAFVMGKSKNACDFPLWCIELPVSVVKPTNKKSDVSGDKAHINLCLRTNRKYKHSYHTYSFSAPVYREDGWKIDSDRESPLEFETLDKQNDRKVWFSPLYPILRGMDDFSYLVADVRAIYDPKTKNYDRRRTVNLYGTFLILLNWDVLAKLMHSPKGVRYTCSLKSYSTIPDNEQNPLVNNFRTIYAKDYAEQIYRRVILLTGTTFISADSLSANYPFQEFGYISQTTPLLFIYLSKLIAKYADYFVENTPKPEEKVEPQLITEERLIAVFRHMVKTLCEKFTEEPTPPEKAE